MSGDTISALVVLAFIVLVLGKILYDRYLAPEYKAEVKVVSKGFAPAPLANSYQRRNGWSKNSYHGVFEVVETGETLKLEIVPPLFAALEEGQRGLLTYNRKYALSFQRTGKLRRRKQSAGEKFLKTFGKR